MDFLIKVIESIRIYMQKRHDALILKRAVDHIRQEIPDIGELMTKKEIENLCMSKCVIDGHTIIGDKMAVDQLHVHKQRYDLLMQFYTEKRDGILDKKVTFAGFLMINNYKMKLL